MSTMINRSVASFSSEKYVTQDPEFSVLIPVRNRADYIRQAIESVLAQTFCNYELLVADDGSTDSTPDVLRSYMKHINTMRLDGIGPEGARNALAAKARGRYLVFLDSDDALLPHALEVYHKVLIMCGWPPHLVAKMRLCARELVFPKCSGPIEFARSRDYVAKDMHVNISYSCSVIDRREFLRVGGVRAGTFPIDDYDLMLRLCGCGPCVVVKSPPTVAYRYHSGNSHSDASALVNRVFQILTDEVRGRYPGGLRRKFRRAALIAAPVRLGMKLSWRKSLKAQAACLALLGSPMLVASALTLLRRRLSPPRVECMPWP